MHFPAFLHFSWISLVAKLLVRAVELLCVVGALGEGPWDSLWASNRVLLIRLAVEMSSSRVKMFLPLLNLISSVLTSLFSPQQNSDMRVFCPSSSSLAMMWNSVAYSCAEWTDLECRDVALPPVQKLDLSGLRRILAQTCSNSPEVDLGCHQ
jgi:hypothetical protein